MVTIGRKRAPPTYKDNPVKATCARCKQDFIFMMKNTARKYCSDECLRLAKLAQNRKTMSTMRTRRRAENFKDKPKLIRYAGYDGT